MYVFMALVGGVLAAFMVLGGGDADTDVDFDFDGDLDLDLEGDFDAAELSAGAGSVLASLLNFRTLVFAAAFFGFTGLLLPLVGAGSVFTFLAAIGVGGIAGFTNDRLLRYLKGTSGGVGITLDQIAGSRARVSVPMEKGRRGKVMVDIEGRDVGMVAEAYADLRDSFTEGEDVVVVEVKEGVARIAPMDEIE